MNTYIVQFSGSARSKGRRQGAEPASISSIKATIFSSAVGRTKVLRDRDLDAAMAGRARDARVGPREGKDGDGACRSRPVQQEQARLCMTPLDYP